MKYVFFIAPVALAWTSTAGASSLPDLKSIVASVNGEYLSYSDGFGKRRVMNAQTRLDRGKTKMSLGLSHGERKAGEEKFTASRLTGTLVHDWNSVVSTRTSASISGNKPVFVTRDVIQDINLKVLDGTVLTAGGRYARYFGGIDARSWSLGAAQYFKGGHVSYRFSRFNIQHLGDSVGHLGSLKIKDRFGSSQLWVGHGTAIHDAEWRPQPEKGRHTNVELQRSHRVGSGLELDVAVKRTWYDTPSTDFRATGARLGVSFRK